MFKREKRSFRMFSGKKKKNNKKKKKKKKVVTPGKITKVRGAKYTFPIEGNIDDLIVNKDKLITQIKDIENDSSKVQLVVKKIGKKKKKQFGNSLKPLFNLVDRQNDINTKTAQEQQKKRFGKVLFKKESCLDMKDTHSISQNRKEKFFKILNSQHVKLSELKKISWCGIPFEFRGLVWKLISRYLPCKKETRKGVLKKKRNEYNKFVQKYCLSTKFEDDESTEKQKFQIKIDIPRTNPGIEMFKIKAIQESMTRMLTVWALRHPASGYVQGMNDILSVFFTTFLLDDIGKSNIKGITADVIKKHSSKINNIEADSFWCFSFFIDTIQDLYTRGMPGVKRMMGVLEGVIKKIDFKLYNHIHKVGLEFEHLFFRWINCLLIREFSIKQVTRIFDTYLSESEFEHLHVYVCAAFLKNWSEHLCKLNSSEFFMFVLALPTESWEYKEVEMLLSQGHVLKSLYYKSDT